MKRYLFFFIFFSLFSFLFSQQIPLPRISFAIEEAKSPQEVALTLQILLLIAIFSLAPAFILMLTSFTKILIVFDFIRRALTLQNMPPTQVIVSLSLFLTVFIMAPTFQRIHQDALSPYLEGKISVREFFHKASRPLHTFMLKQLGKEGIKEIALFVKLSKAKPPKKPEDVPFYVLIPAFMLSELKKAFLIGILIFIPFLVIDIVVASTLMAMGMIMLPPIMVSLPLKIILFVMVDGWTLLTSEIVRSYSL